jgi:Right handed beta helix region
MTRINIVIAAGLALAATLPTVSALAQSPRTFVSAAGSDTNPCSFAAPCRHFQAAVNATSVGGEVDALDPAGYGPIVITQAVTVEGQGWSYIAPPAGGNGITINAGSGNVTIHGVSLNGAGITGPTNGIVFNSGGNLTVTDSVVRNFNSSSSTTGNGILMQPTSGQVSFTITNTIASDNGFFGINYQPPTGSSATANGVIDHITATGNVFGIDINTTNGGGSTVVTISNSIASNNASDGIFIENAGATLTVSVDNIGNNSNGLSGITAVGTPKVILGRSVIIANFVDGISNSTSPNTFNSTQDNRINGNNTCGCGGTDISSPLNTLPLH